MNATLHSELSVKRRGGQVSDFYKLHDFMDSSKEAESSNKHRFLTHTMFFVKEAMIPIFGHSIEIEGKRPVNTKDMLELDHIVADYAGRFIPTLLDFVDEIEDHKDDEAMIRDFQSDNTSFFLEHTEIQRVMMAPLHLTGKIKGLFATHNSWFIGNILPRIFPSVKLELKNYNISPGVFFNRMNYKKWMQNGNGIPPSFQKIEDTKVTKTLNLNLNEPFQKEQKEPKSPVRVTVRDVVFDGVGRRINSENLEEEEREEAPTTNIRNVLLD